MPKPLYTIAGHMRLTDRTSGSGLFQWHAVRDLSLPAKISHYGMQFDATQAIRDAGWESDGSPLTVTVQEAHAPLTSADTIGAVVALASGVPNLDAATDEELEQHANTLQALALYTELSKRARASRLRGDVAYAMNIERAMEGLLEGLPAWARW